MSSNKTTTMPLLLALLLACICSLAAAIPVRTELAQTGTNLSRGDNIGPIVNGTPIKSQGDQQVLQNGEPIELVEYI